MSIRDVDLRGITCPFRDNYGCETACALFDRDTENCSFYGLSRNVDDIGQLIEQFNRRAKYGKDPVSDS